MKFKLFIFSITFLIVSCGGGGGGSSSASIQESSNSNTSSSASSSSSSTSNTSNSNDSSSTSSASVSSNADTTSNFFDVTTPQNDTLIIDGEAINVIGGKAVDGYIDGAKVFIDENFNLKFDDGEIWGVTDASGSFLMNGTVQRLLSMNLIEQKSSGTNPTYDYKVDGSTSTQAQAEEFFACLKKRPLVAQVPVGAIDSTQGLVEQEYEMILPSIEGFWNEISGEGGSDPDYSSIIISPFSNFLSKAVVDGIESVNLQGELSLSEGCSSKGLLVEQAVRSYVNAALSRIQNNFGIDYREFLRDFVAQSTNDIITEENASLIASWLPLLTALKYEIGKQTKEEIGDDVVPVISIEDEVADKFLANEDVEEIDLNFYFRYQTEPNSLGWYFIQNVDSLGSKLVKTQVDGTSSTGNLKPFKCADGSGSCLIDKLDLNGVLNSAEEHSERINFLNESGVEGHEGKTIVILKENRSYYRDELGRTYSNTNGVGQMGASYENLRRKCARETFIQVYDRTNETRWNDIEIVREIQRGYQDETTVLDCAEYQGDIKGRLFFSHKSKSNNANGLGEGVNLVWWSFSGGDLDILENEIKDPYEEKDTLDPKPLLDEMDSFPQTFRELDEMRVKLSTSTDISNVQIQLLTRGADSQYVGNYHNFQLNVQESNDTYEERTDTNELVGSQLTGQAARDAMFNAFKESTFFSFDDYAGTSAP